nr:hypothetical protein BaRGS_002259 [Batillaria attramentaria]
MAARDPDGDLSKTTVAASVTSRGRLNLPYYKMDADPRGICVIINNHSFYRESKASAQSLDAREGTDVDREKLKATFERLKFVVQCYEDQTDTDILQVIQRQAVHDHSNYDCFVCCVLSHGDLGVVYVTEPSKSEDTVGNKGEKPRPPDRVTAFDPLTATPRRTFCMDDSQLKIQGDKDMPDIRSLVVTDGGKIVMTDSNNKKVKVMDSRTLTIVSSLSLGLKSPRQVSADRSGNLYIASYDGGCVLVMGVDGRWRTLLRGEEHGEGSFACDCEEEEEEDKCTEAEKTTTKKSRKRFKCQMPGKI